MKPCATINLRKSHMIRLHILCCHWEFCSSVLKGICSSSTWVVLRLWYPYSDHPSGIGVYWFWALDSKRIKYTTTHLSGLLHSPTILVEYFVDKSGILEFSFAIPGLLRDKQHERASYVYIGNGHSLSTFSCQNGNGKIIFLVIFFQFSQHCLYKGIKPLILFYLEHLSYFVIF